jgi:hypothetical protein
MITYNWNPTTNQVEETTVTTIVTPLDLTSVRRQIDDCNSLIANFKQQLADYTTQINGLVAGKEADLVVLQSQLDNLNQIIVENTPVTDTTLDTQSDPLPDNTTN